MAKPFQIIGDPYNHRLGKWSSTVPSLPNLSFYLPDTLSKCEGIHFWAAIL